MRPVAHAFTAGWTRCKTAQQMGWAGKKNGDLIQLAESAFDLFITSDQNIRYQQNLAHRSIAILGLSTNKLHRIQNAADLINISIEQIKAADFIILRIP